VLALVLRATADGHAPAVGPVVPGQDTPITIRLDAEARIRIECTDDFSRASLLARAASVRLRHRDGALVSVAGVTEWRVPDAGPLIVRHLEPGEYDLRVRVEPIPGTEREQHRTELARSFATVRLAAGGERVVVLPADPLPCARIGFESFGVGRELSGMHVAVRLHRARSADGAFDPAGWVEVPLAKLMAAPYPVDAGVAYRLELRWSVEGFESGAWLSGWTQAASGVSISPTRDPGLVRVTILDGTQDATGGPPTSAVWHLVREGRAVGSVRLGPSGGRSVVLEAARYQASRTLHGGRLGAPVTSFDASTEGQRILLLR
jgi:hypothetical protein